jgi:phosphoglycolate phosphatase-like HAD superfamily hydrolase
MMMDKLIIFDIDGTLLDAKGAGRVALSRTFEELYGYRDAFEEVDLTGKIDIQVIREVVGHHGITDFNLEGFNAAYGRTLRQVMAKTPGIKLLKGVREMLECLTEEEHYFFSLATGNTKVGAKGKLEFLSIGHFFKTGAYGDEALDRKELVGVAIDNAQRYYQKRFDKDHVFYLGDTPKDIEAARHNAIVSVGISTGGFDYEALKGHGPDYTLKGLEPLETVLEVFRRGGRPIE